jgi:hypothetical protein
MASARSADGAGLLSRAHAACTLCGCFSVALVVSFFSLGVWLLALSSAQAGAYCEVSLALFARVDGGCYVAAAALAAVCAVAFVWWAPPVEAGSAAPWPPRAALAGGLVSICGLASSLAALLRGHVRTHPRARARAFSFNASRSRPALPSPCSQSALALAWLGVKLWGTVLLFSASLWTRMGEPQPAGAEPCAPALYMPLAVFMIVAWTLPAALLGLAALAALAWSLWEAYAAATGAGARKRHDDEAAEAERNPWLAEFEGTRATNPWERDVANTLEEDDALPPLPPLGARI